MAKKANIDTLNSLHDRLANYFTALLDGAMREDGEKLNPGEISAILKFLKDNEITADVIESKPMGSLIESFLKSEEFEDEFA